MRTIFEGYKKAAADAGRDAEATDMGVCRNVFIADSEQEARDLAEPAFDALFAAFKEAAVFHDLDNVPAGYEHYQSFFRPFAGEDVSFDASSRSARSASGRPRRSGTRSWTRWRRSAAGTSSTGGGRSAP